TAHAQQFSDLTFEPEPVNDADDIQDMALAPGGFHGRLITADSHFNSKRSKVEERAGNTPATYQWREFVEAGGVIGLGPDIRGAHFTAGVYAARLLRDPAVILPIAFPTHFDLVVNSNTARAIGIEFPPEFKQTAIDVTE